MNCSTPGLPVRHQLSESTQTHVHWSVMPSNHLILCHPLLLLPSIFPSFRVFSNESALYIRWPKYWSFSFNISPSSESSGLIFRRDWLDLLTVQGSYYLLLIPGLYQALYGHSANVRNPLFFTPHFPEQEKLKWREIMHSQLVLCPSGDELHGVTGANSLWIHTRYEGGSWWSPIHCHCPYVTLSSWNAGVCCSVMGVEPTRAGKEKPQATFFPYHLYVEWDLWVPQIQPWMISSILSIILLGCIFCHSLTPPPPQLFIIMPLCQSVRGRSCSKPFSKWYDGSGYDYQHNPPPLKLRPVGSPY